MATIERPNSGRADGIKRSHSQANKIAAPAYDNYVAQPKLEAKKRTLDNSVLDH